ncbi:SusD/RagB family nutrient-binding outer membrane lipoprotein [Segetibacter sp. 3557_3]|uniref:SusD/RagB family nutrient-binding outer membrane lipoprotein n=1 Tax=Segetibacter sp. 3557_3 TaxID=2547429 RepID=UPI001FB6B436|nr:SusD/RagB family nutrient-binding outer membrane lipoprotein [Segetibacter sp. 3557_3]
MLLLTASCKKFIDINDDPNNLTTAQLSLLLPSTEISMVGNMYQLNSGAATIVQHTIFSSGLSRYQQTGTSFDDSWDGFYTQTFIDIESLIKQGTSQQQWGYVAIAKLEKAYLYSLMVDMWGSVPYNSASMGAENRSPVFEEGAAIYDRLFVLIDEAIADAGKVAGTGLTPASADVIYGGSKDLWIKMANALKLKLFNQVRLVDPAKSAAGIKALLTANLINANSADFTFRFGSSQNPNNRHPWHRSEYQAGKTFYVSQSFSDMLFANDDPRLRYFIYRQHATAGLNNAVNSNGYYGRNPGDGTSVPADQTRRSTFGIYPAGGLYDNAPINNLSPANIFLNNTGATGGLKVVTVTDGTGAGIMPLITNAMVQFMRAEAALTLNTGDNARQRFIDAITANLNSISAYATANGGIPMPATTISGFVAKLTQQYDGAADDAKRLELVMTQKYIATYGNGMEAYNDFRRTGLPQMRELLSPLNSFPMRLYYSQSELSTNSTVIANASQVQTVQQTTPVFWDK